MRVVYAEYVDSCYIHILQESHYTCECIMLMILYICCVYKLRMMSTYALRCRCNVYIQYDAYIHAYSSWDTCACVYLWYSVHLKMTTHVEWTKRGSRNLITGRVACHLVRLDFAMFAWFLASFRAPSLRLLFFCELQRFHVPLAGLMSPPEETGVSWLSETVQKRFMAFTAAPSITVGPCRSICFACFGCVFCLGTCCSLVLKGTKSKPPILGELLF